MSLFPAIKAYLPYQGTKYIAPEKAGDLREVMLDLKSKGQAARKEFMDLAKDFQTLYPNLSLERASQWMNQAQILRPHFWNYVKGYGEITEPMFALRLYGTAEDFGVSLEVSFMEQKKTNIVFQSKIVSYRCRLKSQCIILHRKRELVRGLMERKIFANYY